MYKCNYSCHVCCLMKTTMVLNVIISNKQGWLQEFRLWGGAQEVGAQSQRQKFISLFSPGHVDVQFSMLGLPYPMSLCHECNLCMTDCVCLA